MIRQALFTFALSFSVIFALIYMYIGIPGLFVDNLKALKRDNKDDILSSVIINPSPQTIVNSDIVSVVISKLNINTGTETVSTNNLQNINGPSDSTKIGVYAENLQNSGFQYLLIGHFDVPSGKPGIFFDLNAVETGDIVELVLQSGRRAKFVVFEKKQVPSDSFIFDKATDNLKNKIGLMTVGGIWDKDLKRYSERIFLIAQQKDS